MKTHHLFLLLLLSTILSCVNPTDSGMTKKKTITSSQITESKASPVRQSQDLNAPNEEEVIIPKEQIKKAKEILAAVTDEELDQLDGKLLFKQNCSICHGIKGNMKINGAKDLTKSKTSLVRGVAQVYFGRNLMTPFRGKLSDAEIVAVSKYAQSLSNN